MNIMYRMESELITWFHNLKQRVKIWSYIGRGNMFQLLNTIASLKFSGSKWFFFFFTNYNQTKLKEYIPMHLFFFNIKCPWGNINWKQGMYIHFLKSCKYFALYIDYGPHMIVMIWLVIQPVSYTGCLSGYDFLSVPGKVWPSLPPVVICSDICDPSDILKDVTELRVSLDDGGFIPYDILQGMQWINSRFIANTISIRSRM